ncbi:MAG TPA: hypothetical protein VHG53_00135, partial [Candidatus Limnocylindria bacterium]|nr:hypothetical protein [Candidatus Limnocylindria bacterium]
LVIRPELRRLVGAIGSPEIRLAAAAPRRDEAGRFAPRGGSRGLCWIQVNATVLRVDAVTAAEHRHWLEASA